MFRSSASSAARALAVTAVLTAVCAGQITPESGNVGGAAGPFDVLFVNGSSGGSDRTLEIGLNQPITFDIVPNGTVSPGAVFLLYAFVGVAGPAEVTPLPFGIGTAAIPFCPFFPGNPNLLALVDPLNLGCPPYIPFSPAPWTFTIAAGFNFPVSATIQGAIVDPAGVLGFSVTNAVHVRVVDDRVQVLYSKIAGHPTAIVPGAVDTAGNPAVTEFRAFEQLVGSPDGTQWMLRGRTQQGSASETMMMVGLGSSGTVFAQKGRPVHGGAPGEVYDVFGSGLGRFNDANDFAYSARAAGGAAGTLQKVIRVVGGVPSIVLAEGSPCTGLTDLAPNPSGDELFGNSVGSVHLLNNASVGVQDSTITQIHTSRRPAIFYDTIAFHQTGVTQVFGLDGVTPQTWATLDSNKFYTTPDGSHWLATGRIVAPSTMDAVLVVDGTVRLQEGVAIPGFSEIPSSVLAYDLSGNGHWYVRGALSGGGNYAVKDGAVVAKTGNPIVPGSLENWGTSFSVIAGNRNGDWVLFGTTDAGSTAIDNVIVHNGTTVVAREGDPVDLDGNGVFDDDVYIGRGNDTLTAFSADNAFLTDDNVLYMFVNLRNGAGVDLNSNPVFSTPLALVRMEIPVD